ncbi:uncharacterized protein N7483_008521 [Penicillium malachiteum]|uniref:uncharacterized protein n=1 Tax=Penicillium malachiteum TaxID=1324776 RepID=UPI0025473CF5|nr:uncharacterized protein N7483_008521 [Penicillium malachiteum]KAJ5720587.1 hypothetical protein N7483_008521 [Penicillium malachiteum]
MTRAADVEADEEPSESSSDDQQTDDAPVQVPLKNGDDEHESDEESEDEEENQMGNHRGGPQESQELRGSEDLRRPEDSWNPEDFWWRDDSRKQKDFQEPAEPEKDEDYVEGSEEEDDDEEENQRPPSETPQAVIENSTTVVIYDKNQSKQPQPRTRSNKRRQEALQTETEEIQTSQKRFPDPKEDFPDYEDLPRDDPDLMEWLRKKVEGTRMSDDWLEFYVGAYKLPEYVSGPMPSSFENALELLARQLELHVDLEDRPAAQNVPVNFKSDANNLCADVIAEVEGILNFPDIPQSEADPEKAGELVVDLEGYLLPELASLVVMAFKTYTRFGPGESASSPLLNSLDVLFKIANRIDVLRDYYMTSRNRQRSWKLGMFAKRIKDALRKGKLRMFVTGDA